jgi:hypothetical protein
MLCGAVCEGKQKAYEGCFSVGLDAYFLSIARGDIAGISVSFE